MHWLQFNNQCLFLMDKISKKKPKLSPKMQCSVCSVQCAVCTVHCVLCSMQCAAGTVLCALWCEHSAVFNMKWTVYIGILVYESCMSLTQIFFHTEHHCPIGILRSRTQIYILKTKHQVYVFLPSVQLLFKSASAWFPQTC